MAELEKQWPDEKLRAAGYQPAAAARAQMLNNDRLAVIQHAAATGQDPAILYCALSQARGFRPTRGVSKREAALMEKLYVDSPEDFDKAWDELRL